MKKTTVLVSLVAALCVLFNMIFARADIEKHTWVLISAMRTNPQVSAEHNPESSVSNSDAFTLTNPTEIICEAKGGKLLITDKTNNKTYEGTYGFDSWFEKFKGREFETYNIVINGAEGYANIGSKDTRTLYMSIGGYVLYFEEK